MISKLAAKPAKKLKPVFDLSSSVLVICLFFHAGSLFATTSIKLQLDWFPSIEFAGILVALDKGWYKSAGIELEPVFTGLDITQAVVDGKSDVGMHSAHELIRRVSQGAKLKAFAASYQYNPITIITAKDGNIKTLADLKGKTIGIFSPQEIDVFRILLSGAGLSLKDVTLKTLDNFREDNLIQMLKAKKVDAFTGWEFNWPITFALQGYKVRQFPSHKNGFHFYGIVFFCKPEFIKKNRKALQDFLDVTARGWKEVYKKPEFYTRQIIDKWYPKDRYILGSKALTVRQQFLELQLSRKYLFDGTLGQKFGTMSRFKWETSLEIAKKFEIISVNSPLKVDDLFETLFPKEPSK